MEPPAEDYYPGMKHGARWSWRGLPVSVSGPALVIVAALTMAPMAASMIAQSDRSFAWLAAAPPLYVAVWLWEREDAAIFRLMAAALRRLVLVGRKAWGAFTRDPLGER